VFGLAPAVTEIEFVIDVPVHPAEPNSHVYSVAPATGSTENVSLPPSHTAGGPVTSPGVGGGTFIVTVSVEILLVPHVLDADTVMLPPDAPVEAGMEVEALEAPTHPAGSVHV
jgi:hypothetical protein